MKSKFKEDNVTLIRSRKADQFGPSVMNISTVNFSLDHIKQIKATLGGVRLIYIYLLCLINLIKFEILILLSADHKYVISGIVLYGVRLHMQEINLKSTKLKSTALVVMNKRIMIKSYDHNFLL